VAVSHGIGPRFGDWDPYAMAQGAFDEAVRALVALGARLPLHGAGPWDAFAGCDNFCVPDSVYHPTRNPDGAEKLGKLVAMAEGMAEMVRRYEVPLISGKDSMKNDLRAGGVKISVPPTLLITMVAVLPDVERAVTSEWKSAGDWIFLLGPTADELGGSALANLLGWTGGRAPTVDIDGALRRYRQMAEAHDAGLLRSCHDLSEGGLAVALAECCIGAGLGAQLRSPFTDPALWFAESHSRFVVSVSPDKAPALLALFGDDATRLGEVGGDSLLVDGVSLGALSALEAAWLRPLTAPTHAFGHDA
jgi:phosphoribosylformylglycinamidine synthase